MKKIINCKLCNNDLLIGECGKYCKTGHYYIFNVDGLPFYEEAIFGNIKITKSVLNYLEILISYDGGLKMPTSVYCGTYDFKFQDLMIEDLTKFLNKLSRYAMLM